MKNENVREAELCLDIYGPGRRILYYKPCKSPMDETILNIYISSLSNQIIELIEQSENDEDEINIKGVTFKDIIGTEDPFDSDESIEFYSKLAYALKTDKRRRADKRINIWCYTEKEIEEIIEKAKINEEALQLLKYIDILVEGRYIEEKADDKLLFRSSQNQRIIDIKKTLRLNDGYVYLSSYYHLQDYNQTKYKFGEWCRVNVNRDERRIKDLFKYLRLRDNRNLRKDKSVINPNLKRNVDMEVPNNISLLIAELEAKGYELGCKKKNLCKLKYLHNRWCNKKTVLREKLGEHNLMDELIKKKDYVITIQDINDRMVKVTKPRKSKFPKKKPNNKQKSFNKPKVNYKENKNNYRNERI